MNLFKLCFYWLPRDLLMIVDLHLNISLSPVSFSHHQALVFRVWLLPLMGQSCYVLTHTVGFRLKTIYYRPQNTNYPRSGVFNVLSILFIQVIFWLLCGVQTHVEWLYLVCTEWTRGLPFLWNLQQRIGLQWKGRALSKCHVFVLLHS